MNIFLTLMLAAYCFVVHFGSLFRYGSGEVALGISTVLLVLIVGLGFARIPRQVSRVPIFWLFALLFCWVAVSSSLSLTGPRGAYIRLGQLILYLCLAAVISSYQITAKQLRFITLVAAIGLLLSSGLTIIDYQGWVNVPRCNVATTSTQIDGLSTTYIMQAAGFFPRRSGMAAFFALSIVLATIMALSSKSWLEKLIYAPAAIFGCVALLLSHNRSGVVAVAVTLVAYWLLNNSFTMAQRVKTIVAGSMLMLAFLFIATTYFPEHVDVYKRKLSFLSSEPSRDYSKAQKASDSLRIENMKTALKETSKNPFGHGFSLLPKPTGGFIDAHNVFTSIVWAGGIFAMIWLVPFLGSLYKVLLAKVEIAPDLTVYIDAFRFSLLAWLVHNMAHNSLQTGFAWVLLGLTVSLRQNPGMSWRPAQWTQRYSHTPQFG